MLRRLWKESMSGDDYVKYLRKHGIKIGKNVNFRHPCHTVIDVSRPCLIEFGDNLDINDNFAVLTHDFGTFVFRGYYKDFVNSSGKVEIGNNIVFGRNVTILKGVTIGDNCIIGVGSVITKSIPPNSVAAGCPARVICSLEDYYKKRKNQQLNEALEYGSSIISQLQREPKIEDFKEEWVLFMNMNEYNSNPIMRKIVDFRIKGYVPIEDFLNREKPYQSFEDFRTAIHKYLKLN